MGRHCYNNVPSSPMGSDIPNEWEIRMIKRSARWVVFLSILQFITLALTIFVGGILFAIIGVLFVSFGIVGGVRKNYRYLMAHFVFSVILYIASTIGLVLYMFYCPHFNWILFTGALLHILLQAIGVRHSRLLMAAIKRYNLEGISNCRLNAHFQQLASQNVEVEIETVAVPTTTEQKVEEQKPMMIPMMTFPQQQQQSFAAPPYMMYPPMMQPSMMQPSMMQQPISVMPQGIPYFTPFPPAPAPNKN
jgi:hypothetical protein